MKTASLRKLVDLSEQWNITLKLACSPWREDRVCNKSVNSLIHERMRYLATDLVELHDAILGNEESKQSKQPKHPETFQDST